VGEIGPGNKKRHRFGGAGIMPQDRKDEASARKSGTSRSSPQQIIEKFCTAENFDRIEIMYGMVGNLAVVANVCTLGNEGMALLSPKRLESRSSVKSTSWRESGRSNENQMSPFPVAPVRMWWKKRATPRDRELVSMCSPGAMLQSSSRTLARAGARHKLATPDCVK
jgi:hypothetical protein